MYSYGGADKLRGNLGDLLVNAIQQNDYFKTLQVMEFDEVIGEVETQVHSLDAWFESVPSTIFCCLYKMIQLRLTEKQV
jgi:hypothetical protein